MSTSIRQARGWFIHVLIHAQFIFMPYRKNSLQLKPLHSVCYKPKSKCRGKDLGLEKEKCEASASILVQFEFALLSMLFTCV